ncbi:MAG: hypothetical protein N5P05_000975 [Chroococcopsis gigantea SAG 12.99]|nr:hypothetical protein [Chroococcopsis gigantea SAG 12.99]
MIKGEVNINKKVGGRMKLLKLAAVIIGGLLTGLAGMMVINNPGQGDYEKYATKELTGYLKEDVCTQVRSEGEVKALLTGYCKTLVDTGQPYLKNTIALSTKRSNFLIFSIYQTELSFPAPVPSYQFGTVAVMKQFYLYEAQEL